ncbi:hypothetical protein O1M63_38790 [Streptomyces mirabilis]|nr:hypothetical protein [Streptomyces mirabilis]
MRRRIREKTRAGSGQAVSEEGQRSGRRGGGEDRREPEHQERVEPAGDLEQQVHEQVVQTVYGVGVGECRPQVGQGPPRHVVGHRLVPPQGAAAPYAPQPEGEREQGGANTVDGVCGAGDDNRAGASGGLEVCVVAMADSGAWSMPRGPLRRGPEDVHRRVQPPDV